ncbi:hypothetical protein PNK_1964 [Candidatus Protochlamydia naegleriophila]|uniref:Uncharacterized protein n=1 Tax=Candidatus Protochlamydia naegleriophila TaxID=389348 RepID=A0A0U5ETL1_9BACT|nr:hypothetical protein [Candidatus Protochlamydia naegleriophila]CUI17568.1 hypothetical protein PNK_1964 [Candidatus Protochlamydia naegleriophila]
MGLISNITGAARWVGSTVVDTGTGIKKGVLWAGEGISRGAYDIYDLRSDGFEKWTKFGLANLKLVGKIFEMTALFKGVIETLEGQKNIYYATKFIGSICDFMAIGEETFKQATIMGGVKKFFTLPNFIKIFYGIGNCLDPLKFGMKMGLWDLKRASELGTRIGNYQVFNRRLEDIPLVGSLSYNPKDFFVFTACCLELTKIGLDLYKIDGTDADGGRRRGERIAKRWDFVVNLGFFLKMVGTFGKMGLITFGRRYGNTLTFAVCDVVTQNAGLIKFWMDRSKAREARFCNPAVPT